MKSLRVSSLPILMAILVLASLRPVAAIDRALDLVLAPTRLAAELSLPLRWLRRSAWKGADEALAARREVEGDAGADLVLDLRAAAEPADPDLRLRGRLVPVEVIVRQGDEVWVAVDPRTDLTGLRPGLPAVVGEVFLGRVAELDADHNRARVELVTGSSFFVGGILEEDEATGRSPLRMTVGGLDPTSDGARLAVHNPSDRTPRPGQVRVLEPAFAGDVDAQLAEGFLLGELVTPGDADGPWSVRPPVGFESGLSHLSLVLPRGTERPRDPEPRSALRDGAWIATRPLSVGDPSPGRRGLVLSTGTLHGVEPGAAVLATTRLVGRVLPDRPVAPLSARVQLLGEPGLELNAMARLDVDGSARILGGFHGLGMVDGRPAFEWRSTVGLGQVPGVAPGTEVAATLYTGAGLEGVPAGLLLGRAHLMVTERTDEVGELVQTVVLESWTDGLDHRALWVRRGRGDGR